MKFFQVFTFATLALSLPSPRLVEDSLNPDVMAERDENLAFTAGLEEKATVTDRFTSSVGFLQRGIGGNANAIQMAAAQIRNTTNPDAIIRATGAIRTNYRQIYQAVQNTQASIMTSTTGALGGVAGSVANLTQQEVNEIIGDFQQVLVTLARVRTSLAAPTTNMIPQVAIAARAEMAAVRAAMGPFVTPISVLANAVIRAAATARLNITGLTAAVNGITTIASSITQGV